MAGHSHSHHDHAHAHGAGGHARGNGNQQRLLLTLLLASAYLIAEIVGGLLSNSLALLADAGHMFSDVASLGLSAFAVWLARQPSGSQRTYGFHRAEILAALINATTLVAVSLFIFKEAWERFQSPPEVRGGLMMSIAIGGLLVNLAGLFILHGGREENLNVRGAWLHVLSDALGSVAAISSGLAIYFFDWFWADPLISVVIGLLILYSSWHLLAEAVGVLMETAPASVDVAKLKAALTEPEGVIEIHDLHVWTISSGLDSVSCHVVSDGSRPYGELLSQLRELVHERCNIDHVTIQIEPQDFEEPVQRCEA
ncbi:cation diffusion facilitator family transporter [bacterium]|nr:cation diffusion facilitator family transporter [bacterium]